MDDIPRISVVILVLSMLGPSGAAGGSKSPLSSARDFLDLFGEEIGPGFHVKLVLTTYGKRNEDNFRYFLIFLISNSFLEDD